MAKETELKFTGVDFAALRKSLQEAGADFQSRVFERNLVFDTEERTLRHAGTLLRLRSAGDKCKLTLKAPPTGAVEQGVKVWEETEFLVGDFASARLLLEGLGYSVAFAYEKVREKWTLDGAVICLDLMPFGEFVEIEAADRAGVLECAAAIGLASAISSTATYHQLNREHRAAAGLAEDENFIFSDEQLEELKKSDTLAF